MSTVISTPPAVDRIAPSLSRPRPAPAPPGAKSSVMDTLPGRNNLAALDESGRDPYNATGRHFRR